MNPVKFFFLAILFGINVILVLFMWGMKRSIGKLSFLTYRAASFVDQRSHSFWFERDWSDSFRRVVLRKPD